MNGIGNSIKPVASFRKDKVSQMQAALQNNDTMKQKTENINK